MTCPSLHGMKCCPENRSHPHTATQPGRCCLTFVPCGSLLSSGSPLLPWRLWGVKFPEAAVMFS